MSELWDQAKEILALVLEQPPESRDGFIRDACGANDALRSEVESLLGFHDKADSLLENPLPDSLVKSYSRDLVDARLGPYRIVREIGHGGMAVVLLGERDDEQFRKRVAIKVLRPGIYPREVLQRFRNERQTLAGLDHPNIVKLLDGGATAEGLPYLVMDYVEGAPIDTFCRTSDLGIPERLRLFLKVCAAVHYAHENGVIHRDLKPGNIVITKEGVPRLLDFGIAKLLNSEFLETPLTTRTEYRPMTLEYASPEQVRGGAITRASDIYSLGVLLYEVLTGRRPFQTENRSRLEMERLICEQDPERPSLAVERAATGGRNRLDGDLDTIVLKALRKEPEKRYASVAELADDIERHLAGRPVQARNLTLAYRGGRFLRRHKESVTTAAAVLALVASLGFWQEYRSRKNSDTVGQPPAIATHVRRSLAVLGFRNLSGRAETAWVSTALSQILSSHLAAGEELRVIPQETVARTKGDLSLTDAETVDPNIRARVRKNLGSDWAIAGSYRDSRKGEIQLDVRLEDLSNGETLATASETGSEGELTDFGSRIGRRLRERLKLSGISALETEQIRAAFPSNTLAWRLYSEAIVKTQAFDSLAARDLLVRAVAADPRFAVAHSALAAIWATLGYDPKAREEAKQALDRAAPLSREDRLLVEGRYYEAARNWEKAIATYRVLVGFYPDSPEYGLDLANAQISGSKGKDAIETLSALAQRNPQVKDDPRIELGVANAATVLGDNRLRRDAAEQAARKADQEGARLVAARARNAECRALANLGDLERARTVCEEGRRIFAETGDRGGLARLLHNLAEVPLDRGDLTAAAQVYREALGIMREIGDLRGTATELVNLGLVSAKQGDFPAGLRMYGESFRDYELMGDKNGMAVASGNKGNLLRKEGKLAEALASYQQALAFSNELGRRGSAALALSAIGDVRAETGDLAGAREMYQQALAIQRQIGEKEYAADTLLSWGAVFLQEAATEQASKMFEEASAVKQALADKEGIANAQLALAELSEESGNPRQAEKLARTALEEFQAQKEPDQIIFASTVLARSLRESGRTDEASQTIGEALPLARKNPNLAVRFDLALEQARLMAANGKLAAAERRARHVLDQAADNQRLRFDASLAVGEIIVQEDRRSGGRWLQKLASTARAKGFELIARKAEASARPRN